jgi:hypothetical protein
VNHPASMLRSDAPPAMPARRGGPTDPSHDEDLRRGVLRTAITQPVARVMCAAFVALIAGVPLGQALLERRNDEPSMLLDLFTRAPTKASLHQFEQDLEAASYAKEWVQPRVQERLTRHLRVGNKKAVVGHDRWLYYTPGVMYVGGPGFLDPEVQRLRVQAAVDAGDPPVHPDPRPAVLALHRALAARGIRLVLFPVPDKAAVETRQLHGREPPGGGGAAPIAHNRDYHRFVAEMRAAGVAVFEPLPPAAVVKAGEPPRYLAQDTHWTPAFMQDVATQLAGFVKANVSLPAVPAPALATAPLPVARVGDVVDMLKLPEDQRTFAPQAVTVRQVRDARGAAGALWQPKESGDVLLLGDSFTNVFTLPPMGWGEAAGLAPQLALALGRDVDVIAQNDSGSFATRKLLSEALGAGEDRLAGKRLVIWEFAARELAAGDWRPLDYQLRRPP